LDEGNSKPRRGKKLNFCFEALQEILELRSVPPILSANVVKEVQGKLSDNETFGQRFFKQRNKD
jgi:hypothetical protein